MQITYVCNEYPPAPHGGIGTFVHTIAHGMAEAGHTPRVVGIGPEPGKWNDGPVEVITLPQATGRKAWIVNRWRLHRWLKNDVQRGNTDVIEVPDFQGDMPLSFPYCPVVVRLHLSFKAIQDEAKQYCPVEIAWCERQTLKRHPNWIAVSRYILEQTKSLFRVEPASSAVIYNPVCALDGTQTPIAGLPDRYLLFAGSVSKRKGALALAEACRTLFPHYPDLHLVYAGGIGTVGEDRVDTLVRSVLGEDLAPRAHFLGQVSHGTVIAAMRNAAAFVFPSRLESFGLTPLEAMLCGTPVVYTCIGPGPEIVQDGVTGRLVDPYCVREIAEAVKGILDHPDEARAMAQRGRDRVATEYTIEKCVEQSLTAYRLRGTGRGS